MAASFVLHLDHDGIMLTDAADGKVAGTVKLDEPDFDARVAALRALAGEAGAAEVDVVLPASQILYTETAASGLDAVADAGRVRAALEGMTPYAVDELVIDWREDAGRLRVAVVARETLMEAEGFAREYGFRPARYFGEAQAADFPGRPRFRIEPEADGSAGRAQGPTDEEPAPGGGAPASPRPEPAPPEPPTPPLSEASAPRDTPASATGRPPADAAARPKPAEAPEAGGAGARKRNDEASGEDGPREADTPEEAVTPVAARAPSESPSPRAGEPEPGPGRSAPAATCPVTAPTPVAGAAKAPAATPGNGGPPRVAAPAERPRGTAPPPPAGIAPSRDPEMDEAESLTVFGARRMHRAEAAGRGDGARIGLMLTLAALVLMGVVALWALWFDAGAERQTGAPDPEAGTVATAELDASPSPEPSAPAASAGPPPEAAEARDAARETQQGAPSNAAAERAAGTLADAPGPGEPASAEPEADRTEAAGGDATETPAGDAVTNAPAPAPSQDTREESAASAVSAPEEPAAEPPDETASRPPEPAGPSTAPSGDAAERTAAARPPGPAPGQADAEEGGAASTAATTDPDRFAPEQDRLADLRIATADPGLAGRAAPELPALQRRDSLPPAPENPLPFGTRLGPDGFVVPTEEGARAPGGYLVRSGPPPIVPPRRPDPGAALAEPDDAEGPAEEAAPEVRPRARPDEVAPPPGADTDQGAATGPSAPGEAGTQTAAVPDDLPARPRGRPATLAEAADAAEAQRLREERVAREEARAAAEALAAAGAPPRPEEVAAEGAELQADLATSSRFAVATAPPPRGRPANIAQIAARAEREAARAEAQAAARAAQTPERATPGGTTAEPAPAAAVQASATRARGPVVPRREQARPSVPSSAAVARAATERNALRMADVTLIGVYGPPNQRRALVRLPSGRYSKVQVGDRLDGGRVAAIGQDELRYVKGGQTQVLRLPRS